MIVSFYVFIDSSVNILFQIIEHMYLIDVFPEFVLKFENCSEPRGILQALPRLLINGLQVNGLTQAYR